MDTQLRAIRLPLTSSKVTSAPGWMPTLWTVLPPITSTTLAGWWFAERVREHLAAGWPQASDRVLAVLFLLFIDQVPAADLVLDVAVNPSAHVFRLGNASVVRWQRPHFKHSTDLILHACTGQLLSGSVVVTRSHLLREVLALVQATFPQVAWPSTDSDCWANVHASASAWRRIEFAPSTAAMSLAAVPAPSPSAQGLARLAGLSVQPSLPLATRGNEQRKRRSGELQKLAGILNRHSDTNLLLGLRRQRAKLALKELKELAPQLSGHALFWADWLDEELHRAYDDQPGRLQISSIATYFSALTVDSDWLGTCASPSEWDNDDWQEFVSRTDACIRSLAPPGAGEKTGLHERLRPALAALWRSLARQGHSISPDLWRLLGESAPDLATDSASSTLVLRQDLQQAVDLALLSLEGSELERLDSLTLQLRALIASSVPVRHGDLASLEWQCITRTGLLTIRNQGFNLLKTEGAVRTAPLPEDSFARFMDLKTSLATCLGHEPRFLFRLDGTQEHSERDNDLHELWGACLKAATGDLRTRPHSVRASVACELAWPQWEDIARELISGEANCVRLARWVDEISADSLRLAKSAAAAGHSDLRALLTSYLSAWVFVHTASSWASLSTLELRPGVLERLTIKSATLRKAEERARAQRSDLCRWGWVHAKLALNAPWRPLLNDAQASALEKSSRSTGMVPTGEDPARQICYLQLRLQSLPAAQAQTAARINTRSASSLEVLLSNHSFSLDATSRLRHGAQPRARKADLKLALSPSGTAMRAWALGLDAASRTLLVHALGRDSNAQETCDYGDRRAWAEAAAELPQGLVLVVQRGPGARYSGPTDAAARVLFEEDRRLGSTPRLTIRLEREPNNRVMQARLKSLMATSVLAAHALGVCT